MSESSGGNAAKLFFYRWQCQFQTRHCRWLPLFLLFCLPEHGRSRVTAVDRLSGNCFSQYQSLGKPFLYQKRQAVNFAFLKGQIWGQTSCVLCKATNPSQSLSCNVSSHSVTEDFLQLEAYPPWVYSISEFVQRYHYTVNDWPLLEYRSLEPAVLLLEYSEVKMQNRMQTQSCPHCWFSEGFIVGSSDWHLGCTCPYKEESVQFHKAQ